MSNTGKFRQNINAKILSNNKKEISAVRVREVLNDAADAIDEIFETFSLADGLGTYNATTGVANIKETGVNFTPVTIANQDNGKYFDVTVAGTQSITGTSLNFKVGDRLVSRGTKWDLIPNVLPETVLTTDSISSEYNYGATVDGSYIVRTTGAIAALTEFRRTVAIPLSALGETIKVDIANFGGSIAPVAYYNSSVIDPANYVGNEIATIGGTYPSTSSQLTGYKLTPPSGATHVVFSWRFGGVNNYFLKIYIINKDLIKEASVDSKLAKADSALALSTANNNKGAVINNLLSLFGNYSVIQGEYIVKTTGAIASGADFRRTSAIPISLLRAISNDVSMDIGNYGASVAIIAYYTSDVTIAANFISTEVASSNTGTSQIFGRILTIPSNATHLVVSCYKLYDLNIYCAQKDFVKSTSNSANSATLNGIFRVGSVLNSDFTNPYISIAPEGKQLYKRSVRLANVPSDSDAFIVISGQSNADGRIPQASAPAWLSSNNYKIDNYLMWNKNVREFTPYQIGVNTGASTQTDLRYGFDIYFAKAWLDANPGKKLYAVRQTLGGVPITEKGGNTGNNNYRWQPKTELITAGQGSMCLDLIAKLIQIKSYCAFKGIKILPTAILWHQGEGDADRQATAGVMSEYPANLANLFNWFRGLFFAPQLPILSGNLLPFTSFYTQINTIQSQLAALDSFYRPQDMTGHTSSIGDNIHFDDAAGAFLGQQCYNNFISL